MSAPLEAARALLQERLGPALALEEGLVATPPDVATLVETMGIARKTGIRVLVRGLGLRLDWGEPVRADLVVSTSALTGLVDHAPDDMVVTAEAGMTLAALNARLATRLQVLPLEVAHPERTTLGGLVAAAPSSLARTGYGEVKDWLIGLAVATPEGTLVKGGGRVVKNVAGYDLCKLYAGSLGTLGAIATVTFRVRPAWEATALLSAEVPEAWAEKALAALQTTALLPAVSALEARRDGVRFTLGFDGPAETVAWQVDEARRLLAGHGAREVTLRADAEARHARAELARTLHAGPGLGLRLSVLPSAMLATVSRVRALPGATDLVATGLTEHGALWLRAMPADPLAWLATVRAVVREHAGHVSLEGRAGWPEAARAHELSASTCDLMRRVQAGLDPQGIMAPGRFCLEGPAHGSA